MGDILVYLFQPDRPLWSKILGGLLLSMTFTIIALVGVGRANGIQTITVVKALCWSAAFGTSAGLLLEYKDRVRRRLKAGEKVNWLSRLYFGLGPWSGLIWIVTVLVLAIPLIVLVFGYLGL